MFAYEILVITGMLVIRGDGFGHGCDAKPSAWAIHALFLEQYKIVQDFPRLFKNETFIARLNTGLQRFVSEIICSYAVYGGNDSNANCLDVPLFGMSLQDLPLISDAPIVTGELDQFPILKTFMEVSERDDLWEPYAAFRGKQVVRIIMLLTDTKVVLDPETTRDASPDQDQPPGEELSQFEENVLPERRVLFEDGELPEDVLLEDDVLANDGLPTGDNVPSEHDAMYEICNEFDKNPPAAEVGKVLKSQNIVLVPIVRAFRAKSWKHVLEQMGVTGKVIAMPRDKEQEYELDLGTFADEVSVAIGKLLCEVTVPVPAVPQDAPEKHATIANEEDAASHEKLQAAERPEGTRVCSGSTNVAAGTSDNRMAPTVQVLGKATVATGDDALAPVPAVKEQNARTTGVETITEMQAPPATSTVQTLPTKPIVTLTMPGVSALGTLSTRGVAAPGILVTRANVTKAKLSLRVGILFAVSLII